MRFNFSSIKYHTITYLQDNLNLAVILSLVLFYFYNNITGDIETALKVVIVAGIVTRTVKHYAFWGIITLILLVSNSPDWYSIDNHIYLMIYWSFALTLTFYSSSPKTVLNNTASLLIGFCFLFATFWKMITPEYMNGTFFQYLLIGGDARFDSFALFLTNIDVDMINQNKNTFSYIKGMEYRGELETLHIPQSTVLLSTLLTWWTLLLEGLIAISFLVNKTSAIAKFKHYLLFIFILTTYPVAPVITFGLLLVCMGVASTKSNNILCFYITAAVLLIIIYVIGLN